MMNLRVSHCLELLKRMRLSVAAFAEREEHLAKDVRTRRHAALRKYNELIESTEATLAGQIEKDSAYFQAEMDRIGGIAAHRTMRIQEAHNIASRRIPRNARETKTALLGELQLRRYHLERSFAAAGHQVESTYATTSRNIQKLDARRAGLEDLARKNFRGYGSFRALLGTVRGEEWNAGDTIPDDPIGDWQGLLDSAEAKLHSFRRRPIPLLFSLVPPLFLFPAILLATAIIAWWLGPGTYMISGVSAAAALAAAYILHRRGGNSSMPAARDIADIFDRMTRLRHTCEERARTTRDHDLAELQAHSEQSMAMIESQSIEAGSADQIYAARVKAKIDTQLARVTDRIARQLATRSGLLETARDKQLARIQNEADARIRRLQAEQASEVGTVDAEGEALWAELEHAWRTEMIPAYREVEAMGETISSASPAWDGRFVQDWAPATSFIPFARFARLDADLASAAPGTPSLSRLALPGPSAISIPLALTFPAEGSLVFETEGSGGCEVIGMLNHIIFRLLSASPPGKISFTIIDPVGLGQNFAGLMHLSDYEESIINRKIWTQRDQIEERMEELSEHIEKVIQMYLRNEYATITEYNEQAGSVAEKYLFLVIADFPGNVSESAARRLQSILASGPRCGVFTLIHRDLRQPVPDGFALQELHQHCIRIRNEHGRFVVGTEADTAASVVFDAPPSDELAVELTHKIGRASIDSNRVEVPFSQIAPSPEEMWTNDTTHELRIAIGRTGATKHQYLAIGKGTRQHALFAGKTGSGKSTLFHVIITNLALACSPDQVEFYLIDFKKGVEFKCYATKRLPHARVVAIESEREFALSVLQRVDAELRKRGDMFRRLGVQDVAGYKRAGGTEEMPRTLLLIDEFQEFFVEDDSIAQTASLLLDRIVRQGRAFGIHVLLGSQTLGGSYSLARATLGQMVIRVALQCNEADAYLIMDENNSAPRLLSRPGEGIYNDSAGAIGGNSPFQVVWLPDDERDHWLDQVNKLAASHHTRRSGPIVFEGNAPADIRENEPLNHALRNKPSAAPPVARCWLGAPNSIKGPTEVAFRRQSGNHLLIVGQRDEAAITMLGVSLVALAAQYPPGTAEFILLHASPAGSQDEEFFDLTAKSISHDLVVSHGADIGDIMNGLATDLKSRLAGDANPEGGQTVFLFIHGLHKFKKLRQEDEFSFSFGDDAPANPGAQFNELINEGSAHGIHIIATVDTLNNVNRCLSRKAQSEFEMRVVFQMSANDSASLIDSPKASTLGLHRALYYNEHEGTLETFRPYAVPSEDWFKEL